LKEIIQDFSKRIEENPLPTDEGVSYLNVKFHMILCYLINLGYYLLCKSRGTPLKDHPVMLQLLRIKTILNKIQPLDNKLKYQIEKLIKMASLQQTDDIAYEQSKLGHKPNLKYFEDVGKEENIDSSTPSTQAKYVPPKRHAVLFDDAQTREQKQAERKLQKAKRSRIIELLKEQYSDAPQAMPSMTDTDYGRRSSRIKEEAVTRYEEDSMRRISDSKKETKKKRRYGSDLADGLSELESYSDLAVLTLKETSSSAPEDINEQEESFKPKKSSQFREMKSSQYQEKYREKRAHKRRKFISKRVVEY